MPWKSLVFPGQEGPSALHQGTSETCWLPPPKKKLIRFGLPVREGKQRRAWPYIFLVPSICAGQGHCLPGGHGYVWLAGLVPSGTPEQPSAENLTGREPH